MGLFYEFTSQSKHLTRYSIPIIWRARHLNKRYATLIVDLRTDSPMQFQFTFVFFFRRILYASIFIILSGQPFNENYVPTIQVALLIFIVWWMLSYLIIIRPYESLLSRILCLYNELMLLVVVWLPMRFIKLQITQKESSQFGTAMIAIIISTISVNWIWIIVFGIIKFIIKKRKSKKLKIKKDKVHKIDRVRKFDLNKTNAGLMIDLTTEKDDEGKLFLLFYLLQIHSH